MPRANIFIRNANLEKWQAIADKSKWINDMLATPDTQTASVAPIKPPKVIKTKVEAQKAVEQLECKGTHYMLRKGCGKPKCPWSGI